MSLERLFKKLDTNEDGRLSKEEIRNGFNEIWEYDYIDDEEIEKIFE